MSGRSLGTGIAIGTCASTATTMMLLGRYLRKELRPPVLHHRDPERDSQEEGFLLRLQLLLRDYWPHPVFEFSGYISTVWTGFWAILPTPSEGRLEVITLNDGGTVSLHWAEPPAAPTDRVVLLLPGLNNDSKTSFVQGTMGHFRRHGFQAVALNYRGVGGLQLTSPRIGCGGDGWQDLPEVIAHIERSIPDLRLYGVGFSMGAGMLLNHLGTEGAKTPFVAAACIACPVDFPKIAESLESSFKKRVINFSLVTGLKLFVLARSVARSPYMQHLDQRGAWTARTIRQFDAASIVRLHGYKDVDDYYHSNNPKRHLSQIAVPTFIVNAEDDPVVSITAMPLDELRQNPNIFVAVTRRGGHIGWGKGGLGATSWTDSMACRFFKICEAHWPSSGLPPHSRL